MKIQTRANPLLGGEKSEIALKVAIVPEGVQLQSADGLPLGRVTTARDLKWAVLVKEGSSLLLFQGDGIAVEEFRIAQAENMMAVDAGDVEVRPPGSKSKKPEVAPKRLKALRPGDDL